MSRHTISAVVPVYNGEEHVAESLTGILAQTRRPDEIVVVDDGSTDGTAAELAGFGGAIRVVRQANSGVAGAMNRCFAEARCEFVAKCDADDVWQPDKLARQSEALERHDGIDVAFGGAEFFGELTGPRAPHARAGVLDPGEFARRLYRGNLICASTMLVRRSLFERIGPFSTEIACEDYDFWLRALRAGAVFFNDPEPLVRYRAHAGQVSGAVLRMHEAERLVHELHAELIDDPVLVRKVRANDRSNIARVLSDERRYVEARSEFVSSLRARPTARVLAWVLVLSTPDMFARPLAAALVRLKRSLVPVARGHLGL